MAFDVVSGAKISQFDQDGNSWEKMVLSLDGNLAAIWKAPLGSGGVMTIVFLEVRTGRILNSISKKGEYIDSRNTFSTSERHFIFFESGVRIYDIQNGVKLPVTYAPEYISETIPDNRRLLFSTNYGEDDSGLEILNAA